VEIGWRIGTREAQEVRALVLHRDPAAYAARELTSFGGIRRGAKVGWQLAANLECFSGSQWDSFRALFENCRRPSLRA
jgi:hypothetical protein